MPATKSHNHAMRRLAPLFGVLFLAAPAPVAARRGVLLLDENIEAAANYSRERAEVSLIVFHRGRILLEEYPGGDGASGNRIASCVKSLWGLLAAAAVQDRLLSFDEPVSRTLKDWKADPRKARITIRHLLSMTSGLDPGYEPLYVVDPDDAFQTAVGLPALDEPGKTFVYGPANMEVFGALLEQKLAARGLTPLRYLEKRILGPVGGGYTGWSRDKVGHPMMSSGAFMTARQLLAVGRLLARRGVWSGRRLVASEGLSELLMGTPANPAYGMTFWLNANASRADASEVDIEKTLSLGHPYDGWGTACVSKAAPPDLFVMVGSWNQRVYVVPSLDLVVVRQGNGTELSDADFLGLLFKKQTGIAAGG